MLTAERHKRNGLITKYNRGVNIILVIDIGLGRTGVGLLSTIVAAPAVIEMQAVSIAMGLLLIVGNRTTKMLSLKKKSFQTKNIH